jgi:uncharacterized protein YkwD
VFAAMRLALRRRAGRLSLGVALTLGISTVILAMPVVSGAHTDLPVSESASSSTSGSAEEAADEEAADEEGAGEDLPLVIMGVDGDPSAAAAEGTTTAPESSAAAPGTTAAPEAGTTAPGTTGSSPSTSAPGTTAAGAPAPSAPAPAPSGGAAEQVLALVNHERAAAGCGAVTADGGLAAVALAHSADMRDRGFFDHTNPEGLDPFDRAAAAGVSARAENIAWGQPDAAAVMVSWMASPGHRANILDCGLTRLGVGVAEGPGGPWWTQLFG